MKAWHHHNLESHLVSFLERCVILKKLAMTGCTIKSTVVLPRNKAGSKDAVVYAFIHSHAAHCQTELTYTNECTALSKSGNLATKHLIFFEEREKRWKRIWNKFSEQTNHVEDNLLYLFHWKVFSKNCFPRIPRTEICRVFHRMISGALGYECRASALSLGLEMASMRLKGSLIKAAALLLSFSFL